MSCINEIDVNVFLMCPENGWIVNDEDFRYIDQYGDPVPERASGSMFIPESAWSEFYALQLVETTGMPYSELCNLRYDEYYRISALARAKAWTPQTRPKSEKYL